MNKIRVFKLKHRVPTLFRFKIRQDRTPYGYHRVNPVTHNLKPICRLLSCLKRRAKALCSGRVKGRDYSPLNEAVAVPKGKLAVYVGQTDGGGGFRRIMVPVIYFNHPLFGDLLREAEEEFGFDHPGGITIPCQISEFEKVKTRIAAGCGGRKLLTWKKAS